MKKNIPTHNPGPAKDLTVGLKIRSCYYREANPDYHTHAHIHLCHQWYHLLRGEVRFRIGAANFELKPGQSLLIPPHAIREVRCTGRAPAYIAAIFELDGSLNFDALASTCLQLPTLLDADLLALVREARKPGIYSDHLVRALLIKLMIGLSIASLKSSATQAHSTGQVLNRTARREMVERIRVFMRQHHNRNISREDVAEHIALSPGHAARLFRQETGQTLLQALTEIRIALARQLLIESTLSISQIALEVGYNSFSHFSQTFKKHEGCAPGDFRRLPVEMRSRIIE